MKDLIRTLLSAPASPQMKAVAFLLALLALLLFGNAIRVTGDIYLWPWIVGEWGADLAPFVYVLVWAGLFLIIFMMLNLSLSSSMGMLLIFALDKATVFF